MPEPVLTSQPITQRTIGAYLGTLGSSDPAPGGGSAAGVIGALGASLGLMVVSLTNTDDAEATAALEEARETLVGLRDRFTSLAEDDERVFMGYQAATHLPRSTPEEKAARKSAMQEALKHAASVPLTMAEGSVELARAVVPVQTYGNPHLLSDARIAMLCAGACFEASRINVNVNLAMIKDAAWVSDVADRVESLATELQRVAAT